MTLACLIQQGLKVDLLQLNFQHWRIHGAFGAWRESRSALSAREKEFLGKDPPKLADTETNSETAGTG